MYTDVNKGRLDLIVLRYMARSVHLILLREAAATTMPALSYSEERRGRIHRIAVYDPQGLQEQRNLAFVGFVSRKHQPLSASIVEDIHEVDRKLVAELIGNRMQADPVELDQANAARPGLLQVSPGVEAASSVIDQQHTQHDG